MSRSQQLPFADPLPALSRTERHVMLQEAYESYEQLFTAVRIARSGNAHATALGGVSGKTTGTVMMCTTARIAGTLEEVAALYTAQDSPFILDFAQSARLYELEAPSKDHPMRCVGLRWSKWNSISKLVTDRDLLYLETMDEFIDKKTGHRGWARCTKSIEHRACPASQHPNGPLRAELFVMGMVVRETATRGELELITLVHADVKNRIPSWITRTVLKRRKKNALTLGHVLKVRRHVRDGSGGGGGGGSLTGDSTGAGNAPAHTRTCKGCMDRVSRWTRSFKCRKCTELICKSCAAMTYFDTDTQEQRNRICAECSFGPTDEDDDASDDGEHDVAATDADAHSQYREGRHRENTREETKSKGDDQRQRTYSYLSVEEPVFPAPAVTEDTAEATAVEEDLGSTMHKLNLLNQSHVGKENHGPPELHRQSSSDSAQYKKRPQQQQQQQQQHHHHHRGGERAQSQDEGRSHRRPPSTGSSTGTDSAPGSRSSVEAAPAPASVAKPAARKTRSHTDGVAVAAAPAPMMIDLSYLQSFSSNAKASSSSTPAEPPAQAIGQLV